MRKVLLAAVGALAVATASTAISTTPAAAHHPSWLWYQGYKYYAADYYKKGYCFYHHGYIYCRGGGGGGSGY